MPIFELGVGYTFAVGSIDLGPSVRYVKIVSEDPMAALGTADLALVGIDLRFGADRAPRYMPHTTFVAVEATPPPSPPEIVAIDPDADEIVDRDASCIESLEGCPIAPDIFVVDDRIVLDERVLFDVNRARVRGPGREALTAIARAWRAHPEWKRITVEGHADVRGSDAYNQQLSQLRAERCRTTLVKAGFDAAQIDAVGYGRSRPRDPGTDEAAFARNRRVEFVIDRRSSK
ncbi:MAG: OmpA family protein [Proteobacteria bacterium]|nr:OmpA family protein [Pseudomonadota bacterium]